MLMKKSTSIGRVCRIFSTSLVVAMCAAASHSQADDNISVYGRFDISLHYSNNVDPEGRSRLSLEQGATSTSRWGVRGSEDLGGGYGTMFMLEGGFNPDDGSATQGGALFGRSAIIGLTGHFGSVTMGLQNTPIVDTLDEPFGWANLYEGGFLYANYVTKRWSDSLKYAGRFGSLSTTVIVALGEQADNARGNRKIGGSVGYVQGRLTLNSAYQQMRNTAGIAQHKAFSLSGTYTIEGMRFYLGCLDHSSDMTAQKNTVWNLGMSYAATPAIELIGAYYLDHQRQIDGDKKSIVTMFNYKFSKLTNAYLQADYSKINTGYTSNVFDVNGFAYPSGVRSRATLSAGMRIRWN